MIVEGSLDKITLLFLVALPTSCSMPKSLRRYEKEH